VRPYRRKALLQAVVQAQERAVGHEHLVEGREHPTQHRARATQRVQRIHGQHRFRTTSARVKRAWKIDEARRTPVTCSCARRSDVKLRRRPAPNPSTRLCGPRRASPPSSPQARAPPRRRRPRGSPPRRAHCPALKGRGLNCAEDVCRTWKTPRGSTARCSNFWTRSRELCAASGHTGRRGSIGAHTRASGAGWVLGVDRRARASVAARAAVTATRRRVAASGARATDLHARARGTVVASVGALATAAPGAHVAEHGDIRLADRRGPARRAGRGARGAGA